MSIITRVLFGQWNDIMFKMFENVNFFDKL